MIQPVMFNGVEIPSFIRVVGIKSAVLPPAEVVATDLVRAVGQVFHRVRLGSRVEQLDIVIQLTEGRNIEQQKQILSEWLIGNNFQPSPLTYKEQEDRYIMATLSGNTDIDDLFIAGKGSIEFIATDPLKYLYEPVTISRTASIDVVYPGTAPAPLLATVTITKKCSHFQFVNETTNKRMIITGNFTAGQKVTFDCARKRILLDDIVNMSILAFDSEWLTLEKGLSHFGVYNNWQQNEDSLIKITYTPAFY